MTSLKTTGPVDLSKFDMSALIREANSNHNNIESVADEVDTLKSSALGYALCAGAALSEAKSRLNHGEWLPWLAQNFTGGLTTAQNYLRIYDRQGEMPNTQPVAHFGVKETLKLLASPRPKSEPKPRREPQPEPDDAPAEVVERKTAPASATQNAGHTSATDVIRYVITIPEVWPPGRSYGVLIATMRQTIARLEKLEAQNGGEQ